MSTVKTTSTRSTRKRPQPIRQGEEFGELVAVEMVGRDKRGRARWLCACRCGEYTIVRGADLRSGATETCGDRRAHPIKQPAKRIRRHAGEKFGRLTLIERVSPKGQRLPKWSTRCDCGNVVTIYAHSAVSGNTTSCGCLAREGFTLVSYRSAHLRVTRDRGSAIGHPCVDCGEPADEWALDVFDELTLYSTGIDRSRNKGKAYSLDPSHYVARCKSCHRDHDTMYPRDGLWSSVLVTHSDGSLYPEAAA